MGLANWNFALETNYFDDFATAPSGSTYVSMRASDANWERVVELRNLEEITAVEPSEDQLELIGRLDKLKRLRVASGKLRNLEALENLPCLEELALIWVRDVSHLKALTNFPKLHSLYLENINSLSDFSEVKLAKELRTLEFDGKIGKQQSIDNLEFILKLKKLQILKFRNCLFRSDYPVFKPIKSLQLLKDLSVLSARVSLDDWAYLCAEFPCLREARDPLIFVQQLGRGGVLQGIHSGDAIEASDDGHFIVEFGVKGFGVVDGIKSEVLPKVRRFEAKWLAAQENAKAL